MSTTPERTAGRLLNSSAQRWYDPAVDLDWDAPLAEDKDFHPEHRISLYGTELWAGLNPEQRRELGKQEIAAIASFGIAAEVGLMSMLLKFVMQSDLASDEARYALTEIADECRHSTMFARSIEYSGARIYRLPPAFRKVFSNLVSLLPTGTAAWSGTLLVEELVDRLQRETMADENLQPGVRMINRIHVMEEARHISFAREKLRELVPSLSATQVAAYRVVVGALAWAFPRVLIDPRVYRSVGLDPVEARRVALSNPRYQQTIRWMAEGLVGFFDEVGLIGAPAMPLWRRSFMLPAGYGEPVPLPQPAERRRRFVTGDGTALRLVESGPRDAPVTVVFAHGWVLDNTSWADIAHRLHRTSPVRTVRYDHRGHGASGCGPVGCSSVAQLADDLAELVAERVPTGKLVLVGHSMGGMTLMAVGERHPELVRERVAGVAFVATSAGGLPALPAWLPPRVGARLIRTGQRLGGAVRSRDPMVRLPRAGLRYLLFGAGARKEDVDLVARQLRRAHPESMLGFRDSLTEHERCAALAAYASVPAVVLAGGADRLCPPGHARRIARALPEAEFVIYPQAGHMLPNERSDEVAARIAELIRRAV
jgi:pimeloyl-ACP methyl ester carboxylesterase